jgi:membrane protein implicated in regulation of membrane protease activity
MDRPLWKTALKIVGVLFAALFVIAAVSAQVLDVMSEGLTWQHVAQWVIGGAVTYGLYRFYRHGRDTQSDYRERWDQLFDRETSA